MKTLKLLIGSIFKLTPWLLGVGLVFFWAGESFGQSQTFNANGPFKAPDGITSINVQAWGGGGAGGGSNTNNRQGGGGGGGAYRITNNIPVIPGNTYNIFIGSGGAGIVGNGAPGGTTTATFGPIVVTANGGAGGSGVSSGNNGTGGLGGSEGSFNGGNGANGNNGTWGGGGSSAGTA